jgi:hypothetical protein
MTFARLCRDLFLLSHLDLDSWGAARGSRWEQRIADYLSANGVPIEVLPGGYSVFGHASLSGLRHQVDTTLSCSNAFVIAELKAHRGTPPKNELLRFKAVTDDYFMSIARDGPAAPIMRLFCCTGVASEVLRTYAALHGITMIEPSRWPAAVIAGDVAFSSFLAASLTAYERRRLTWLCRSIQSALVPLPNGGFSIPRPATNAMIQGALLTHDRWSEYFWEHLDLHPGAFENALSTVLAMVHS